MAELSPVQHHYDMYEICGFAINTNANFYSFQITVVAKISLNVFELMRQTKAKAHISKPDC